MSVLATKLLGSGVHYVFGVYIEQYVCCSTAVPAAAEHRVVVGVVADAAPQALAGGGAVARRRIHHTLQTGVRRLGNCTGTVTIHLKY